MILFKTTSISDPTEKEIYGAYVIEETEEKAKEALKRYDSQVFGEPFDWCLTKITDLNNTEPKVVINKGFEYYDVTN